ncbi:ATP-binding protein [Sagittula sp. SSi028]|uniref:ATP-binding protein n=1 Tax=Sagittula sp. SSi028 TaxID=3400636 RepID=UPI003AF8137C
MIWARLSFSGKLLFAVILPVLFAVMLMTLAVGYAMRSGFSTYLLETEIAQFDALATVLADEPESWDILSDPDVWAATVETHVPRPSKRSVQRARALKLSDPAPPPPPDGSPPTPPHVRPKPLPERLALFDADGRLVSGQPQPDAPWVSRTIRNDQGARIGELRLTQMGETSAPADAAFLASQMRAIAVAAGIALLCAALVAGLTARQFLNPIRAIGRHVARLTDGDLSSRLGSDRRDELGVMMRDHNVLAERLSEQRKRERQWISDTSHELKTPLSVLRAQIEALQDGVRTCDDTALTSMHHAVMRLARLTDDVSLLSRSDEGRLPLATTTLNMCGLLHDAAQDITARLDAAGHELQIGDMAPLYVSGDPMRLRQVIDNLLINACRYTDPPGVIRVDCYANAGRAIIIVEDTGPCPPPDLLHDMFDRFRRGETSRARSHGGAGLGLSICRALIESHHGTISASRSDLGGLRITIDMPMVPNA